MCCIMMFAGVIAFSFASGALTNFIQQQEESNLVSDQKLAVLDNIQLDYSLPITLYSQLKKSIKVNYKKDAQTVPEFIEDLPPNLKVSLSMHIFKDVYSQIDYLANK